MERWSLLALLRFWLALIVAANHVLGFSAPDPAVAFIRALGSLEAILGFLVVSGYSIGESYATRPQGFWRRRAQRLYPVYALAVVVTWLVAPVPVTWALAGEIALNLLFLNQLVIWPSYVAAAWSLSVEVWLYALAPWLRRQGTRRLSALMFGSLVFYVVQTAGRSLWHWPYYAWLGWGLNLPALAFAWLAGWSLSQAPQARWPLRWMGALFAVHMLVTTAIQCAYRVHHGDFAALPGDLLGMALRGSTLLLVWLVLRTAARAPEHTAPPRRAALWLGNVSYPLFLLHIPLYIAMRDAGVTSAAAMLAAALAAALAAHLVLEVAPARHARAGPFLRWPAAAAGKKTE